MRWVATNDEDEEDHYGYNTDGGEGDVSDCDDIYIMMQCLSVCNEK